MKNIIQIGLKVFSFCFITIIMMNSCISPGVKVKIPDCPQPSQNCYPGKWTGKPVYDTIKNNTRSTGYYYVIEQVRGISTPEDEWQLTFENPLLAIMSFSESSMNRSMAVRKLAVNEFIIDRGITGLPESHTGTFSIRKKRAAFSGSPNRNNNFVKEHGMNTLATTENLTGKSRIYYSDYDNLSLKNIKKFDDENTNDLDWYGHPALSPDSDVMFFVSDKDGGEGGTDIWVTVAETGNEYFRSYNLGRIVNSKCDELSPFVSNDGKRLYFASAGHNTVGGYDIFYSEIYTSFWNDVKKINQETDFSKYFSPPVNIGYPVNTEFDELFPNTPANYEDVLYYSSSQNAKSAGLIEAKGGFDMFVVHKLPFEKDKPEITKVETPKEKKIEKVEVKEVPKEPKKEEIIVKGGVFDKNRNMPIDSAIISVKAENSKIPDKDVYSDKFGKFEFPVKTNTQYEITAQKKEYFFDSKRILFPDNFESDSLDLNFYLPDIGVIRINFPTDEYQNPYKFTLDTNGVETGRYWLEELKLVANNIMLSLDRIDKIVLVGHTDDVGSDDYNMGLGQRRVDFVISELVKLGVPQNVLFGRSAGEREPMIQNQGEELSIYRKRLRRVTMEKFFK